MTALYYYLRSLAVKEAPFSTAIENVKSLFQKNSSRLYELVFHTKQNSVVVFASKNFLSRIQTCLSKNVDPVISKLLLTHVLGLIREACDEKAFLQFTSFAITNFEETFLSPSINRLCSMTSFVHVEMEIFDVERLVLQLIVSGIVLVEDLLAGNLSVCLSLTFMFQLLSAVIRASQRSISLSQTLHQSSLEETAQYFLFTDSINVFCKWISSHEKFLSTEDIDDSHLRKFRADITQYLNSIESLRKVLGPCHSNVQLPEHIELRGFIYLFAADRSNLYGRFRLARLHPFSSTQAVECSQGSDCHYTWIKPPKRTQQFILRSDILKGLINLFSIKNSCISSNVFSDIYSGTSSLVKKATSPVSIADSQSLSDEANPKECDPIIPKQKITDSCDESHVIQKGPCKSPKESSKMEIEDGYEDDGFESDSLNVNERTNLSIPTLSSDPELFLTQISHSKEHYVGFSVAKASNLKRKFTPDPSAAREIDPPYSRGFSSVFNYQQVHPFTLGTLSQLKFDANSSKERNTGNLELRTKNPFIRR